MYPVHIILVIIIYLSSRARAQENPFRCTSNGSYRNNSVYSANLNALLLSLSTNMSDYGFHSASVGAVNGLALCRADQTLEQCRTCVESASREVLQSCPSARQAVIWYESCSLRYSNDPIHNTQTEDPTYLLRNTQNASNGDAFKEDRARLLSDLTAPHRRLTACSSSRLVQGLGISHTLTLPRFMHWCRVPRTFHRKIAGDAWLGIPNSFKVIFRLGSEC